MKAHRAKKEIMLINCTLCKKRDWTDSKLKSKKLEKEQGRKVARVTYSLYLMESANPIHGALVLELATSAGLRHGQERDPPGHVPDDAIMLESKSPAGDSRFPSLCGWSSFLQFQKGLIYGNQTSC